MWLSTVVNSLVPMSMVRCGNKFQTHDIEYKLRQSLWNCSLVILTEYRWWEINIGSGNGEEATMGDAMYGVSAYLKYNIEIFAQLKGNVCLGRRHEHATHWLQFLLTFTLYYIVYCREQGLICWWRDIILTMQFLNKLLWHWCSSIPEFMWSCTKIYITWRIKSSIWKLCCQWTKGL